MESIMKKLFEEMDIKEGSHPMDRKVLRRGYNLRKYGREKRYTFFQLYRLRGKRAY
jgi:hypothetical protein